MSGQHSIIKKKGLSISGVSLGTSIEINTPDRELAEDFLKQSVVMDVIKRAGSFIFGPRIEKNTIDTIVLASNKVRALKEGVVVYDIPLKLASSLLEGAGLEDVDYLREKWASLLANAATKRQTVTTSFVYILKELSEQDVQFLDVLLNCYKQNNLLLKIKNSGFSKKAFLDILKISESEYENITDNLLRLNLIKTGDGNLEDSQDGTHTAFHHKKGLVLFTYLGLSFVTACTFQKEEMLNSSPVENFVDKTREAPPARFG